MIELLLAALPPPKPPPFPPPVLERKLEICPNPMQVVVCFPKRPGKAPVCLNVTLCYEAMG